VFKVLGFGYFIEKHDLGSTTAEQKDAFDELRKRKWDEKGPKLLELICSELMPHAQILDEFFGADQEVRCRQRSNERPLATNPSARTLAVSTCPRCLRSRAQINVLKQQAEVHGLELGRGSDVLTPTDNQLVIQIKLARRGVGPHAQPPATAPVGDDPAAIMKHTLKTQVRLPADTRSPQPTAYRNVACTFHGSLLAARSDVLRSDPGSVQRRPRDRVLESRRAFFA
jgi:hypothetical protein